MNFAELDLKNFSDEVDAIGAEANSALSISDFFHLRKIECYGRIATVLGLGTAWIFPNPITAFLISLGQFTRWLLAHHIMHKGYDKVPGIPPRYTSRYFARGWRRFIDWFDWLEPQAWDYEHNFLHHYHTGEEADPDLAERHTAFLRNLPIPRIFKYLLLTLAALTWKYTYYAPNTLSSIDPISKKRIHKEHIVFITLRNIFDLRNPLVRRLWWSCYLPYFTFRFVALPLLFLPLGPTASLYAFINIFLAECITNLHSFIVIGPNHTASDLFRFSHHYRNRGEFYLMQILGSANYHTGDEMTDYMSIWLNYQIEHHLFPNLPMTKYCEIQPKVRKLCEKHGIPYRQESIFKRLIRMLDVCVGKAAIPELQVLQFETMGKTTMDQPLHSYHLHP